MLLGLRALFGLCACGVGLFLVWLRALCWLCACGVGLSLVWLRALSWLCACGVGLFLVWLRALCWLFAYGVGLSLFCYWFISFPPVRGGTYFSLPAAKKSRQKKAAHTANS
jgi:hypothetical protein